MNDKEIDIEYYDLTGKRLHMKLPPGDLMFLCNVLHDYADLLRYASNEPDNRGFNSAMYSCNRERCEKIQRKIEETIGYSVEGAIKKCKKRAAKKAPGNDIGEDALVLAMKRRKAEDKKETSTNHEEKSKMKDDKQLSLFDFIK